MKIKNLKKKLFIAGANLLILLALLIYVSYSAYRIHVAAELEMLEAAHMQAGLEMTYDLENGALNDPNNNTGWISDQDNLLVLDRLLPGEDADDYSSNPAKARERGREVTFTVVSHATVSQASTSQGGEPTEYIQQSDVPMGIKVVVEETGPIPLEIILKDTDDNTFEAHAYTGTEYGFDAPKVVRFYKQVPDKKTGEMIDDDEYLFRLDTLKESEEKGGKPSRTFKLYFGWNNEKYQAYSDTMKNEVATINVRAELVQLPTSESEKEWPEHPSTASELKVYHRTEKSILDAITE